MIIIHLLDLVLSKISYYMDDTKPYQCSSDDQHFAIERFWFTQIEANHYDFTWGVKNIGGTKSIDHEETHKTVDRDLCICINPDPNTPKNLRSIFHRHYRRIDD